MEILTLPNLVAYSAQVAAIVALATALAWALRIETPGVRYGFWRVVFTLCLLLPFLQGRQVPSTAAATPSTAAVETHLATTAAPVDARAPLVDPVAAIALIVGAGIAFRLLWLAISFHRLRRLRKLGETASAVHEDLARAIGTTCEVRFVPGLRQPVTFGLLRPVVLLPTELAVAPPDIQRAVIAHEFFHVKRRDWSWMVFEEIVCAVLWFNPAVWWLVSRVQLAREVVVDELAVLATGKRRAYVEALVTFADKASLLPVAAFGGRRQLFNRILVLSKEAGMSSRRLVVTCAIVAVALGAGTWHAVGAFPLIEEAEAQFVTRLTSPGPLEQRAHPVTAENPIPKRSNYEPPMYPAEARAIGAWGSVTLIVTIDQLGMVSEARRTSLSVMAGGGASVRFQSTPIENTNFVVNRDPQLSEAIRAAAIGIENAAFESIRQWRYEPPAAAPLAFPVTIVIAERGAIGGAGAMLPPPTQPIDAEGAIRVGGNIKTPTKIKDVRPVYPELALAAKVAGMVVLEIRVGPDGNVEDARVLRSIPLLDQAAIDAVMQWRFVPTRLNGQPVPVMMTVTVNFNPNGGQDPAPAPVLEAIEVRPQGSLPVRGRGRAPGAREVAPDRTKPELVKEVNPTYTSEAMRAGIEGIVEVKVTIGTDGRVSDASVIRSLPGLDEQALFAARQWEFKPLPQPVETNIEMMFVLRK
ncbi:MAG TPA: M56 family metallopeptidase [Vicinamibacterales bacterium]